MSEKLYKHLLKLYPKNFRRTYGDEMLRLVGDRTRNEKGFLSGLRLWSDLLLDLAISLFREYGHAPASHVVAAQPLNGERSFQLLAERSLNLTLLCLGGTLSAVLFGACVLVVERQGATRFPALFPAALLQKLAQNSAAEGRDAYEEEAPIRNSARSLAAGESSRHSVSARVYGLCMTAKRDIPRNSVQPLIAFRFASPGASGVALIDGKVVKRFKNEQSLPIHAHVLAGDHQFVLRLDRPAENAFMSTNADFEYCKAK